LAQEKMTLEQLTDWWSDSFWEKGDEHKSAFILVVAKDGTMLGDRVFPDLRSRRISNVTEEPPGQFIAVGNAFGDRGWALSFGLTHRLKDAARAASKGSTQTYH
jgi:hypothetical protein